jgi:hypothetical protein
MKIDSVGNILKKCQFDFKYLYFITPIEGGYICGGKNISNAFDEGYLLRLDDSLNTVWSYLNDMSWRYKTIYSSIIIENGNFICTGSISNFTDTTQVLLTKLNKNGELIWNTMAGDALSCNGNSICYSPYGEYFVVGSSQTLYGSSSALIICFNSEYPTP